MPLFVNYHFEKEFCTNKYIVSQKYGTLNTLNRYGFLEVWDSIKIYRNTVVT